MDDSHVEKLLMNQQDALLITYDGRSLLHHAILSGNLAVVGAILQRGQTPLLAACHRGQLWPVHQLLAAGADGSVRDASGAGCAHAAAAAGQLTVLQYLGEVVGFSLSDPDDDGRTPVMVAAAGGHAAAVKYLIEQARPSLLSADAGGRTAVHLAAAAGHQHVCWLLVTSGSAELLTAADAEGRAPHQLPSVSSAPSWFALGLVLTLLGASVACVLLYMQTRIL
ncbi:Serine/threonine-protein phosphatase 6 regulatory ankyrin repeat subunit C [Amphibalanus amphitrite]|uniref:Serine/threonine-protein phosphatase 6 regulatory ankyrin repeat subunit C n=1 Tax=Amphibalanus amphitrite TaxID=1232801 RepID=A0A6A4WLN3_AMPAM|nr:Serine/threonine-protein phosphatase 6 regulatory ankyrin repeat subunit C [Amphibalanus amphitrite]